MMRDKLVKLCEELREESQKCMSSHIRFGSQNDLAVTGIFDDIADKIDAVLAETLDLDVITVNLKDAIVEAIWDGDWKQIVADMDIEDVMTAAIRAVLEREL